MAPARVAFRSTAALGFAGSSLMLTGCGAAVEIAKGCARPGVCPKQPRGVMPSGFTNNTGWVDMNTCCEICEGAKRVNCLNPATCGQKTGDDDWDFLVFDQTAPCRAPAPSRQYDSHRVWHWPQDLRSLERRLDLVTAALRGLRPGPRPNADARPRLDEQNILDKKAEQNILVYDLGGGTKNILDKKAEQNILDKKAEQNILDKKARQNILV